MPTNDRFLTLDAVRGVAVLGILSMNIIAFALPTPAYYNPISYGGDGLADKLIWFVNFLLFDGRMRALFSILFGASMVLVIDRATAKGESPARVHFSRMLWLLVFGLVHLLLIWTGDILHHYALMGMLAFTLRNKPNSRLLAIGCALLCIQLLIDSSFPITTIATGSHIATDRAAMDSMLVETFGIPNQSYFADEIALVRSSWRVHMWNEIGMNAGLPFGVIFLIGPETLAYMLFGMVALRSGFLTGQLPRETYVRWAKIGFAVTLPAYAAIAIWMWTDDFGLLSVTMGTMVLSLPFRPIMAMAWAALIILMLRPGAWISDRLIAVGRMAFTNYLVTSIICTLIFYGHGLGLFAAFHRAPLYFFVLAIWAAMILWSKPWLDRFAYGPLEWLWRSLARWKLQPLQKATSG